MPLPPISVPDIRKLEGTPSLPEWVVSLIGLMKDEWQVSAEDGKYRTVPTLPIRSLLNSHQRREIERYVANVAQLLQQTPERETQCNAASLVLITKLMLALPSAQQSEAGAEASGEAFLIAVEDVPTWAVKEAIHRWYRGECGKNEQGQAYSYHWRPSPAELRRVALAVRSSFVGASGLVALRRLLSAEPLAEFDDEHCARMRAKLTELSKTLRSF